MTDYNMIESYLDELIDRIKSMRTYAREENLFNSLVDIKNEVTEVMEDLVGDVTNDE